MKRQLLKRVMAVTLALLLVAGILPVEFLGGGAIAYAAESDEKTIIEFNASTLPDGDITSEMVVGDFTISASTERRYTVDANNKCTEDGSLSFTKRLKSNGESTDTERKITFYAPGPGKIQVYMMSANSGDSSRKLALYNADTGLMVEGQEHKAPVKAADNGAIPPFEFVVSEAGMYCFKVNAAINIYYIKGEFEGKGEAPVQRPAWDSVDDPVINSVTINEAGTIDVDVSMVIGTEGADSARLFMYQDGFEVTSVSVQESGVYTLAPITEGDFKFKVVAYRTGCPDKESLLKLIKDYKLPLVSPEITWLNNLGDGAVYVDWNNIEAEKFELSYKKQGDADYTVVDSNLTDGNYTLKDLEEGKTYEVKVSATKDGKTSESVKSVTVGDPKQQWYVAAIGSATAGEMTVNGTKYEVKSSAELTEVEDVTNTEGTVGIASATNGKIADSEDGFFYYFTKVDPNTENFKLTATFTVTNTDDGPDNQTGYGIYATDIAGIGSKDTKYFNSVSVGQFKMYGGYYHANGARIITGYTAYDALNNVGATRNFNNTNIFSVMNTGDDVVVGDVVTYTLEKTNEGYVASMEGAAESITFDGTTSIMAQEDGSICVGVMAARKVGVEISNIQFEKTEGTAGGESIILTEPVFKVYSSNTAGTTAYEFIASANVAGSLEAAGQTIAMEADKVVKIPVELTAGSNSFPYKFTPDSSVENLTSYNSVSGTLSTVMKQIGKEGETIYVAPDGTAEGKGTQEAPLDLQTALNYAQPGQIIVMKDGTYKPNADLVIGRSVNGTEEKPITLMAENTGKAIIDGAVLTSSVSILSIVGSYWHVYGLEVTNGPAKGISICGNNNIVEMCVVHNVGNSGFQVSRFAGEPNDSMMWPTNNLIKNCEAYDCCDEGRNDADGFAAKLTCGEGNKFYGCISHNNIDDGWDLYAKSTTGPIGAVTIENCVAYNNGFLTTDDPTSSDTKFGEGNGFKLGGENMFGAHKLINCVSFGNYAKGITSNSGPDCEIINCTAYNNSLNGKAYNVSLYTKNTNPKAWVLEGMLSVSDNTTTTAELGSNNGVIYSLRSENNYLFDGAASYNTMGVKATTAWFENTDVSVAPTRKDDGTIDMHGLLVLTADAPKGTGATIVTSGEEAVSVQPQITTAVSAEASVKETSGNKDAAEGGVNPAVPIGVGVVAIVAAAAAVILKKKKK
ncbi:MAG: chondroitinase-B domain-containing protein [Thermoflexaceae bacterium]|nr:chondroitinase-B domain-containing protein [Thermoflexaceae bacterium]